MILEKLKRLPGSSFQGNRPLLLVIMDGVGLYRGQKEGYPGNAFDQAQTPVLDELMEKSPVFLKLKAHGKAVGLPSDSDMGNSEVGHNTLGGGRVFAQGAKLVNEALQSGRLFGGEVWKGLISQTEAGRGVLHFIGLLSDGNVHSHIAHLFSMLEEAAGSGVLKMRIHALADGRDVDPRTYHLYVERLEEFITGLRRKYGSDIGIASGGGRMKITMDRYGADWEMVRLGWETHVLGKSRGFSSIAEAIDTLRSENPGIIDQDLPPFVILDEDGKAIGPVHDGDAVIFFNFRGDRAIEISRAFTEADFGEFDRNYLPEIRFAGLMQYDGDLHIPPEYLVQPPAIDRTLSEYLVNAGVSQLAVAETQKFGHVTYFWNGNNSEKFSEELEDWIEVPSENISFDKRPAMKAREVCDVILEDLKAGSHRFLRVNFANGDMVGHTGSLGATIEAMEVVDECIGRILKAVEESHAFLIVTADHGNCDQMYEVDRKTGRVKLDEAGQPIIKTSHTLSPVPFLIWGAGADKYESNSLVVDPGLGNIAATVLFLLGYQAPGFYLPSLLREHQS